MSVHQKIIRSTYFMIFGIGGFLFFLIVSMLFYTGGTEFDPSANSYNFFTNFLSDLGFVTTFSGSSNIISSIFFAIAMFSIGLSCIPFMFSFYRQFCRETTARRKAVFAGIFGIVSGLGYIGVGLTPFDQVELLHNLMVSVAFGAAFVSSGLFGIIVFHTRVLPIKYGFLLLGIPLIIGFFSIVQIAVEGIETLFILTLTATGQKVTVSIQLILLLLVGRGILQTYQKSSVTIS